MTDQTLGDVPSGPGLSAPEGASIPIAKAIHKYTLQQHGRSIVPMPAGALILSIGNQCDALQLWALVAPSRPLEARHIVVVFTGEKLPQHDGWQFLGTWISSGGSIVAHVFEDYHGKLEHS